MCVSLIQGEVILTGSKINKKDREEMKRLHNAGFSYPQIAEMYNITASTVSNICTNPDYGKRKELVARVTIEKVNAMKAQGMTYKQIAQELHSTENYIKKFVYESKQPKPEPVEPPSRLVKPLSETLAVTVGSALSEANRGRATASVAHVMECMDIGRSVNSENIDSLYTGLKAYVQLCFERDFPMTIANVCLSLGIARKTLLMWKEGQAHKEDTEFRKFAESVYSIVQSGIEATMATGVLNPVLGIWWEKSHFDMKEADRVQEIRDDPLGESRSAEQIAAEYADLPDD